MRQNDFIKKLLLIAAMSTNIFTLMSQITIDECIRLARINYPLYKQHEITNLEEEYNLKNNGQKWLPQLSVNAKASYQSEVVEMPFEIPGYNFNISHYQYGLTADLSQMIWDGGTTKNNKRMSHANADVKRKQLNVTLYNINERVENLFLSILLLDKQIKQNNILFESLIRKQKDVEACIESGIAFNSDLDLVKVNILNCKQQETELENNRSAYLKMLSILTGKNLDNIQLAEPDINTDSKSIEIKRPEIYLYDAQLFQNDVQKQKLKTRISPKFNLTFQAGVGRPGLNMLGNELQPYYLAGIKFQWDLGSLYSLKNDKKKIELQRKSIESERETFLMNTSMDVTEQLETIDKLKKTLAMDNDIISMRERIKSAGEEQYANGVIKMIDLMTMIDDEYNAKLNKSVHEIQLMMAIRKLNNIIGKQ